MPFPGMATHVRMMVNQRAQSDIVIDQPVYVVLVVLQQLADSTRISIHRFTPYGPAGLVLLVLSID
jgi:hypothetical protein